MIDKRILIGGVGVAIALAIAIHPLNFYSTILTNKSLEMDFNRLIMETNAQAFDETYGVREKAKLEPLPDRNSYGVDMSIFSNLPKMPEDFSTIKYGITTNGISIMGLDEAYYLQPELYPSFDKKVFGYYKNSNPMQKSIMGYYAYPETVRVHTWAGASVDIYFLLYSDYCVSVQQPLDFDLYAHESGITLDGLKYTQSPDINRYFSIDTKPALLSSAFPVFTNEWAQKQKLSLSIDENVPIGVYVLEIIGKKSDMTTMNKDYNPNAYTFNKVEQKPIMYIIVGVFKQS